MTFKIIASAHECAMPDPEIHGIGRGSVTQCDCGQRWRLRKNGFFFACWEAIDGGTIGNHAEDK